MKAIHSTVKPTRVLLAGGGFAAVEAILALRELMGEAVQMTLLAPEPRLAYRPAATVEAFGSMPSRAYDLKAICADLGVDYRRDRLEAVAASQHRVRLASYASLDYDVLILALGARATVAIPGALTFRDQRDIPQFRGLLSELRAGAAGRIVFAVPSGCTWPLALYELALMAAAYADENGVPAEISLATPAKAPLELFGAQASRRVAGLLAEREVRFHGGFAPAYVRRDGALVLHFDGALQADRVVAVPQLRGPRISGVPGDWWSFAPTGPGGRIEGLEDVYAAGDMTSFPIKQGGLAAQQADEIAADIATAHGLDVPAPPAERVVRARLLGGANPLFLCVVLDRRGQPIESSIEREDPGETQDDSAKVIGRYLTPYLHERESLVA